MTFQVKCCGWYSVICVLISPQNGYNWDGMLLSTVAGFRERGWLWVKLLVAHLVVVCHGQISHTERRIMAHVIDVIKWNNVFINAETTECKNILCDIFVWEREREKERKRRGGGESKTERGNHNNFFTWETQCSILLLDIPQHPLHH